MQVSKKQHRPVLSCAVNVCHKYTIYEEKYDASIYLYIIDKIEYQRSSKVDIIDYEPLPNI